MDKYQNCISLGWFCGTASAMSMLGLRGFSGPFDWYFSDLNSVLKVIETDFVDFMSKENLQVITDKPQVFCDAKYGFHCNHDIECNFEIEYPQIYAKYKRRAIRFMEAVKYPTCFFRAVRSNQEIVYINENKDYIHSVIKRGNPNNEIIFLLLKDMNDLSNDFISFRMDIECYIGRANEMFKMFSNSEKLIEYCEDNLLSEEKIKENKKYISSSKVASAYIANCLEEDDDRIELSLKKYFSTTNEAIYLWGAGKYGSLASGYMLKRGIVVNAIIDNNEKVVGTTINEVPVISFSDMQKRNNINIFISIISEKAVASIRKQIYSKLPDSKVLTFENIYLLC